jgi:hypothetical protein
MNFVMLDHFPPSFSSEFTPSPRMAISLENLALMSFSQNPTQSWDIHLTQQAALELAQYPAQWLDSGSLRLA